MVHEKQKAVKGIVRIAETDLDGNKKISTALLKIKGIGQSLALAIPKAATLEPNLLLGNLSEEQIKKLESVIKEPIKFGIPSHMVNYRLNPETGEDEHLVASNLRFNIKTRIDFMRKIRSYKGIRHELGLPVRGQRTRSSFRTGAIMGVARKKVITAAKEAKKEEKKK